MGHTRQQYEDRIRNRLGDLGLIQHIPETSFPLAIEEALLVFSKDKPRKIRGTFSGDGTTRTFDLTTLAGWATEWSRVDKIEHPLGEIPPSLVDSHDYDVVDETGELLLHDAPATGTNNVRVTFLGVYPFPDDTSDTDLVPDVYFPAVVAKAAAHALRSKAHEYARQQSTSVAGDLFRREPEPLYEGARGLDKIYADTVLGRPSTGDDARPQVAMAVSDVDVFPGSLFHRRSQYIGEEGLGD